jgi:hypothetical protein
MSAGYLRKCSTKIRHEDRASAEKQRTSMIKAGKGTKNSTNTYGCNVCGGWHVGSIRKGQFRGTRGRRAVR